MEVCREYNKLWWKADKVWPSSYGLGKGLTIPHRQNVKRSENGHRVIYKARVIFITDRKPYKMLASMRSRGANRRSYCCPCIMLQVINVKQDRQCSY